MGGKRGEQVAGAPILAVGNSFTYSNEVNDGQTWPAQLQLLTGRRVLNAGVSGYGFDQIVLRAEKLAAKYKPSVIVVSFIADNIRRTQMRRLWSADKPYFVMEDGKLSLRGVPVPPRADAGSTLTFWQWTLGYSYLVEVIMRRLDQLHDWYGDHKRVLGPGMGRAPLLPAGRAARRAAEAERRQGDRHRRVRSRGVGRPRLRRRAAAPDRRPARLRGEEWIDDHRQLRRHGRDRSPRKLYVTWHLNEPGNRLIAELVAKVLPRANN